MTLVPGTLLACLSVAAVFAPAAPQTPARPVPFTDVTITDSFWTPRQKVNATATLAANWAQCEKTGRLSNFARAAAKLQGKDPGGAFEGYFFNDSDVYKMLEGACEVLATMAPGAEREALETKIDGLIAVIASAQHESGYINGYFTLSEPDGVFRNLRDKHELYCAGHLIEAAVAHKRATGKDTLLGVATKLADHIDATFGPAPKRPGVCGHEEIELALIKLAALTGADKYRALATYFVEQRGNAVQFDPRSVGGAADPARSEGVRREVWGEYWQDYAPVREHSRAVGHAVRATYFYSAVTDLARLTGDEGYAAALDRVWNDLTDTKMYVTGGIGTSSANEGFTTSYDLPNETAYAETCAGIGLVLWGHRMQLLHGDRGAPYIDIAERALYNAVLSGVSMDGTRFFYDNPLASRGKHLRQEWFGCACCPPNILRLIAQVAGMAYSQTDDRVFVNLYMGGAAKLTLRDKAGGALPITLTQETSYPWSGEVKIRLDTPRAAEFTLSPRIPGWCKAFQMKVNGVPVKVDPPPVGFASIDRVWNQGDTLELNFDMPPERIYANPAIKADVGRVAIQRGPLVYCFEAADQSGVSLRRAALPADGAIEVLRRADELGGAVVLSCRAIVPSSEASNDLYRADRATPASLIAIPYHLWANRTPGDMLVWMPESLSLADAPLDPDIKASASFCYSSDTPDAMYDRQEPANSCDHSIPRISFWPHRGTTEWVRYDFAKPRTVGGARVYWFDDEPVGGQCRIPESWRVLALVGEEWREVAASGGVAKDKYNAVTWKPLECRGLKIEVKLRGEGEKAMSAGILEWKLE